MKRRIVLGVLLAMTMVAAMLTGCGNGTKTTATTANETKKTETVAETKSAEVTQVELPEMATPNEWVSRFDGVKPTAYEEFGWTDDQITSIKDAGLTVGLVMHTGGESFSNAVIYESC